MHFQNVQLVAASRLCLASFYQVVERKEKKRKEEVTVFHYCTLKKFLVKNCFKETRIVSLKECESKVLYFEPLYCCTEEKLLKVLYGEKTSRKWLTVAIWLSWTIMTFMDDCHG